MMDLKGTWKCRNGYKAYIGGVKDARWWGSRDYTGFQSVGSQVMPGEFWWDENGNYGGEDRDWDLMERLSDKWSSERALG